MLRQDGRIRFGEPDLDLPSDAGAQDRLFRACLRLDQWHPKGGECLISGDISSLTQLYLRPPYAPAETLPFDRPYPPDRAVIFAPAINLSLPCAYILG